MNDREYDSDASADDNRRAEWYSRALADLQVACDRDANMVSDENALGIAGMIRQAILNAAMQRTDELAERIAARINLAECDVPALVKRLRLNVIMNRLDT